MENTWKVYMLRCCDGSLYTGITTDVTRRVSEHNSGKGAKYTRSRKPVTLVYEEICENHSHALRRELEIKSLRKEDKLKLISEK